MGFDVGLLGVEVGAGLRKLAEESTDVYIALERDNPGMCNPLLPLTRTKTARRVVYKYRSMYAPNGQLKLPSTWKEGESVTLLVQQRVGEPLKSMKCRTLVGSFISDYSGKPIALLVDCPAELNPSSVSSPLSPILSSVLQNAGSRRSRKTRRRRRRRQ